jgi:hypothetical protein
LVNLVPNCHARAISNRRNLIIRQVRQVLVAAQGRHIAVLKVCSFQRPDAAGSDTMIAKDWYPDCLAELRQEFSDLDRNSPTCNLKYFCRTVALKSCFCHVYLFIGFMSQKQTKNNFKNMLQQQSFD